MKPKKSWGIASNEYESRVVQGLGKLHRQTVNEFAPDKRKKTVKIKGLSMVHPLRRDVRTQTGYRGSIEPGYYGMDFVYGKGTQWKHRVMGLRDRNEGWVYMPYEIMDPESPLPVIKEVTGHYTADQMRKLLKSGKMGYMGGYDMRDIREIPHSAPKSKKKSKKRSSGRR